MWTAVPKLLLVLKTALALLILSAMQSPAPPVTAASLGPGWTRVASFRDYARGPQPDAGWRWSAPFHIRGGTVRVIGNVTSDRRQYVGFSLALQQRQTSGDWMTAPGSTVSGMAVGNVSGTAGVEWSSDSAVGPGEYRLGDTELNVGVKLNLDVYVKK